jgi:hypothetical protein
LLQSRSRQIEDRRQGAFGRATWISQDSLSVALFQDDPWPKTPKVKALEINCSGECWVRRIEELKPTIDGVAIEVVGCDSSTETVTGINQADIKTCSNKQAGAAKPG